MEVQSSRYEFRIRGQLGERLLSSFNGFDAEMQPPETILRGSVADQAALHGLAPGSFDKSYVGFLNGIN